MEIIFRRKTKSEWTALYILVIPFLFALLVDVFRLPDLVIHTVDIAWIALLAAMLNKKTNFISHAAKKLLIISSLFFAFTLAGFLLNYQSVFYYLWGLRNNARFFIYFFACIFFIKSESTEKYLDFFDLVFWINAPIMLYQFFVMGIKQDYLGGIFGVSKGCNSYTNILFVIVAVKSILYCFNHKESVTKCLLKCAVAVLLAALAELKAFYIELVVILALAMCFTRASYRKFWITVGAIAGIIVGIRMLEMIFPTFDNWFNLKSIWETATSKKGYTATNDMNRLTTVTIALERFLPTIPQKLFGLGLGNCDYASFEFLITPFYRAYNWLNYMWFSSAMLILETGLVGMGLYIWFFVQLFLSCRKLSRDSRRNIIHCQLGMICSVMCGFLFILNGSLRTEAGYMMFFVLALPFVSYKKTDEPEADSVEAIGQTEMQNK